MQVVLMVLAGAATGVALVFGAIWLAVAAERQRELRILAAPSDAWDTGSMVNGSSYGHDAGCVGGHDGGHC